MACYTPARLAEAGVLNEILHPQYLWTQEQMSSAVGSFFNAHMVHLTVLAVNALQLFEVPVVCGIPDFAAWYDRTRNRELVIYLTCTVTPAPFSHRFNQLEVIGAQVEAGDTTADNIESGGNNSTWYSMCIVLVSAEVDGRREQVGTNWRYQVELSRTEIGRLGEMGVGLLEAQRRLNGSITDSRQVSIQNSMHFIHIVPVTAPVIFIPLLYLASIRLISTTCQRSR
jgi:hypothetical protein